MMNKQDSEKAAQNDSATSPSHCATVTEELFPAIQLQKNYSNSIGSSNLRLRCDKTEISANVTETGHRSDTDPHCDENNTAIDVPRHQTSLEENDKFSKRNGCSQTDKTDGSISNEPDAVPKFKPHKVNFRPLPTNIGEPSDFSYDDNQKPFIDSENGDSDCNPVSPNQNCGHCNGNTVCTSHNAAKSFQPIVRRTRNKRIKRTCGHLLNSRMSSTDDALSVISEESLSNAESKSLGGSHRLSIESTSSQLQARGKTLRSRNTSKIAPLEDPWVRYSTSDPGIITPNPNTPGPNSNNGSEPTQSTPSESRSTRLRFRTESQNELHMIESNDQYNNLPNRTSEIEYENRERERNDIDLLSRPSWCDAKFALSRIEQDKAKGNKAALKVRAFLHHQLFRIGCFIQRNASVVLIFGILVLCACSVGLKLSYMETNIEKLWVETGGELEEEIKYTKAAFATSGSSDPSVSSGGYVDNTASGGNGYSYLMLIQTGENTLSVDSLNLHKRAAIAATKVTVTMYNQTWGFTDVCYKEQVPLQAESGGITSLISERLFPCFIITPLDCFWEGAKLLGPNPAIHISPLFSNLLWTNMNPLFLLNKYVQMNSLRPHIQDDLIYFREVMHRAGITSGYTERWCLDPYDGECPQTAPNYNTKEIPNLESLFTAGCNGFAENYMKWPLDLILGGIQRKSEGNVTRAQGLQTLFSLMGAQNMFEYHQGIKTGPEWSIARAQEILQNWERQFAKKIYEIAEDLNITNTSNDELFAFTVTTTDDILKEFSKISYPRLIGGCLLMMGYACLSLMKSRASRSQGAVGILGVMLVVLSVAAGLGICSFIGISFNAASTQVLPFLLLGLGVDDMFLMAHHFGEVSVLSHIPFKERTGECLKRVGVNVFLTSIAILSGFLFSLIIPMPALRAFALQAIIVTTFNLFTTLIIFPAVLSIDLIRRKNNKLDILFCFDSSTANEVVDLNPPIDDVETCDHSHVAYYHHQPIIVTAPAENQTHLPGQTYSEPPQATITMRHTIQTYANNSYVTVLQPTTETTVSAPSAFGRNNESPYGSPRDNLPTTPPPEYTPQPREDRIYPHPRARVGFENAAMSEASSTGYSTPITGGGSGRTSRRGNGSGPPTNLTTPMQSVRSSTHSLVPRLHRSRRPVWWRRCFGRGYTCVATLPKFTLSQLGERYYAPLLLRNPVRIGVMVVFVGLLSASIYGATVVRDGLDFGDILPRGTREHSAIVAQTKYFSFQNMYIVTKSFDYASNQESMRRLHRSIGGLSNYVMRNTDGTLNKFWLDYFRDWLQDLQDEFDEAWKRGEVNNVTWISQEASDKVVLAYKLLQQTGRTEEPTDPGRIGCRETNRPCERVNIVRLVSDDGIIREDAFYNYLSAWVGNDPLTYSASQAQIRPAPEAWFHIRRNYEMIVPRSSAIYFAQMPFYLNNMRETEDFVAVINQVRSIIETIESETPIEAYPNGYPFLFWQQYITLRFWLFISLACVIGAAFLVLSIVLINPWAAGIMALFLCMIAIELFGFMGLAGVKLSAVPAVILVASIGLGVAFTVHIVFAFITSCGSRKDRSRFSIGHMLNPIVDGAISTLLGVIMLAGAEFDFIITYFFQVLVVLIFLGLLNGLVLLPVVLSLIGPPSEVIPLGGGSRLKTPTPPPSPIMDIDVECEIHHPRCGRYSYRHRDASETQYYQRRPTYCHHRRHYYGSRYSSRDDLHTCTQHRRCPAQRSGYRRPPNRRRPHPPPIGDVTSYLPYSGDYGSRIYSSRVDGDTSFNQAPFRDPPPAAPRRDRMGQVFFCPPTEYVVFQTGATPPNEPSSEQHCETDPPKSENGPRQAWPAPSGDSNQVPTLTATSSVTVQVRSRPSPVVEFPEASTSSRGFIPVDDPIPYPHQLSYPPDSVNSPHFKGHFDISALNKTEKNEEKRLKT